VIHEIDSEKLFDEVKSKLYTCNTLLDIGCGIRPQEMVKTKVHICAEPFEEYVKVLNEKINNDNHQSKFIILNSTWQEIIKILPPKSVDTVMLMDVIEHLSKEEGEMLLNDTCNLARKQIAIFTPKGFMPQISYENNKDAWGLSGGKWQEHLSGWDFNDFDSNWNIYWSSDFHKTDHDGNVFPEPYGAMWCILDVTKSNEAEVAKLNFEIELEKNLKDVFGLNVFLKNNHYRFGSVLVDVMMSSKMTKVFMSFFHSLSNLKKRFR
jgi:hypothetical protein